MDWVYKIAGTLAVVCGTALILAWLLLRSVVDPDGLRMFGGDQSVGSLAAFGILLICVGAFLAWSKPKPGD